MGLSTPGSLYLTRILPPFFLLLELFTKFMPWYATLSLSLAAVPRISDGVTSSKWWVSRPAGYIDTEVGIVMWHWISVGELTCVADDTHTHTHTHARTHTSVRGGNGTAEIDQSVKSPATIRFPTKACNCSLRHCVWTHRKTNPASYTGKQR
jgi:hypothetical protein